MKLQNRNALITGACRGIGRAIALAFAREGCSVAVTARSGRELERLKEEAERLGVRCCPIEADLTVPGGVDLVMQHCEDHFGPIDILVNNAGLGSGGNPKPVHEFDDEIWRLTLSLNLTVPYLFTKRVLPGMIRRRYGRIINIASLAGKVGLLHGVAYSASKHGLLGLTRTTALEVIGYGITVNAICPGPVRTRTNDERMAYDAKRLGRTIEEHEAQLTPLGRRLEPEEVAALAVYLASEESSAVTGQAFNVDGGVLMSG